MLDPVDIPIAHAEALVANDLLKKLGLAVELATSDWGHCSDAARVKKADRRRWVEPLPDRVGWRRHARSDGERHAARQWQQRVVRLPNDDRLEALRMDWLNTSDSEARQEIAAKIQQRAFEVVPYIPTGQWSPKTAYRKNIEGVIAAPAFFMWNVEKA